MQTLLPIRRPASRHPRRAKRSSRVSQAFCKLVARPCAASQKNAAALVTNHKKNPQPRFNRNQQYSITAVSDGGGSVVERYAYSAYGQVTIADTSGSAISDSAISNRYTYTGREWDEGLSLYHYRARMYDAVGGRFVSRDPIGFKGSKWNIYEYVNSHPLIDLDPSGLQGHLKCCGKKTYSSNVYGCCGGKTIYNRSTMCCENLQVVNKLPIWSCASPHNDVPSFAAPVICTLDVIPGVVTQPFGCRFKHSYICLDGPNLNCWGIDSNCSISISSVDWMPYTPKYEGPCKKKLVCPAEKRKFGSSTCNLTYGFFFPNCSHHSGTCGEWYY